jgi:putative transposase
MPRPILVRTDLHPYHITSRCQNQEFFPIPLDVVWSIMMEKLELACKENKLAIHAFVLMGNHFHLLCQTPCKNIDEIMHSFLRSTSMSILNRSKLQGHLWAGRYKWSLIDNQSYYYQVYRYIYQNPIRAGIVERVEQYKYSTIHDEPRFPLHSFMGISLGGRRGELEWLNEQIKPEHREQIKKGLKKYHFGITQRKSKDILALEIPK